ncbi:hypothetical protein ACIP79_19250 [Streptomyces sp. NPDC088747]
MAADDLPERVGDCARSSERHAAVQALYSKGMQIDVIAKTLGLDRQAVRR